MLTGYKKHLLNKAIRANRRLNLVKRQRRKSRSQFISAAIGMQRGSYLSSIIKKFGNFTKFCYKFLYQKYSEANLFVSKQYFMDTVTRFLRSNCGDLVFNLTSSNQFGIRGPFHISPDSAPKMAKLYWQCYQREIKSGNFGQVFSPQYDYYVETNKGKSILLPTSFLPSLIYDNFQLIAASKISRRWFSCHPNLGAAYETSVLTRFPFYSFGALKPDSGLSMSTRGLIYASHGHIVLPYCLAQRVAHYMSIAFSLNSENPYLQPQGILSLCAPFLYQYFSRLPSNMAFNDYSALRHGKYHTKYFREAYNYLVGLSDWKITFDDGTLYTMSSRSDKTYGYGSQYLASISNELNSLYQTVGYPSIDHSLQRSNINAVPGIPQSEDPKGEGRHDNRRFPNKDRPEWHDSVIDWNNDDDF